MSKYAGWPKEDIEYVAANVKTVPCSEGTKYFVTDGPVGINWRWLTPEEKTSFIEASAAPAQAIPLDDGGEMNLTSTARAQ